MLEFCGSLLRHGLALLVLGLSSRMILDELLHELWSQQPSVQTPVPVDQWRLWW